MANISGLIPTFFIDLIERLVPIRNNVTISPFLAINTNIDDNSLGKLQYVFSAMAIINKNINHGIDILFLLSWKNSIVTNARGIIHNARVSFIKVAF